MKINRAPVLTLWACIVAERLGHDPAAALTLGKALAGLNAQAKGRRLGIYGERPDGAPAGEKAHAPAPEAVPLMGRAIPSVRTPDGLRALDKGKAMDPQAVQRYLGKKFGCELEPVRAALRALAEVYSPEALDQAAFGLYESFRPAVPAGARGWGAQGELDLARIARLAKGRRPA